MADRIDTLYLSELFCDTLDKPVPWQWKVCQTDNLSVVYYSKRGEEPDSFMVRYLLSSLEKMEGCESCHAGRFPATFDSKAHAVNAARKLVKESEVKNNGDS